MDFERAKHIEEQLREIARNKGLEDDVIEALDELNYEVSDKEYAELENFSQSAILRMIEVEPIADMLSSVTGQEPEDVADQLIEQSPIFLDAQRLCGVYQDLFSVLMIPGYLDMAGGINFITNAKVICDIFIDWLDGGLSKTTQEPEQPKGELEDTDCYKALFYSGLEMGPEFSLN